MRGSSFHADAGVFGVVRGDVIGEGEEEAEEEKKAEGVSQLIKDLKGGVVFFTGIEGGSGGKGHCGIYYFIVCRTPEPCFRRTGG